MEEWENVLQILPLPPWIVNEKDWQRPCNYNTIMLTQQLCPFYGLVVTSSQRQLPIATLLKT